MNMTIRRRKGLMALVAAAALVVAVGYLWWFSQEGGAGSLALGVLLGCLAVAFGRAAGDARTPLLVADETGLRVRLGRDWTGIPWGQVQRIEVAERGRVRDGHVAVLTTSAAASLEGATWRSRCAAVLNRWLYDAPFVVPYGPTTICSVVDVQQTLTRLAAGRAPVVDVELTRPEPKPTVVTQPADGDGPAMEAAAEDDAVASPETTPEPVPVEPVDVAGVDADAPAADAPASDAQSHGPDTDAPAADGTPDSVPEPTRPPVAAKVISAFRSRPARREEVTVPYPPDSASVGTLALSDPFHRDQPQDLPEAVQLRYLADDVAPQPHADEAADRGNVALIIDATTDLSKRAMSKVRRPATRQDDSEGTTHEPPPDEAERALDDDADVSEVAEPAGITEVAGDADVTVAPPPLLIGGELTRARQHLGLSVDDLAERTRIRPSVIEALEVDDVAPCGGDFYARGHLRMLARVLGISADELLTTYDTHFATNPVSPRQVFEVELASGTTGMVRGTRGGSRWGGLIAAVLVLALAWGLAQYFLGDSDAGDTGASAPQNPAGLGSPGVGNPVQPPVADPIMAHVKATAVGGDSRIVVRDRFKDVVFKGMLVDGTSRKFVGESPLRVKAADGGVVELSVRGKSRGLMGEPGEQAHKQIKAKDPERRDASRGRQPGPTGG
jgi:cytoskeleton protein RodZ